MRQLNLLALIIVTMFVSCVQEYEIPTIEKEHDYLPKPTRVEVEETEDGLMVLGPQLANPYLLTTMQQARAAILQEYPLASIPELETSHYYVRFAPQNDDELYSLLQDTTVVFYEYPLDREVISGTYYHDPAIADSIPTYQYASISKDVWDANYANSNIAHTILANLFIPEEAQDQLDGGDDDGGFDWEIGGGTITPIDPEPFEPRDSTGFIPFPGPGTGPIGPNGLPDGVAETNGMADLFNPSAIAEMLVDKSLVISGHETEGSATLAKNDWIPSGRITVYDDIATTVPLVGAKVRVRRWFTTHTAITDEDGEFICDKGFNRPANYSIVWERAYWDIRDGSFGQAYYNGPKRSGSWILRISGGKSQNYASIHRAAHRFFYTDDHTLLKPSFIRRKISYHHRSGKADGRYWLDMGGGYFPDIQIFGYDSNDGQALTPSYIFSTTAHELGHAAHWCNSCWNYIDAGLTGDLNFIESWAECIAYILTNKEYEQLNVIDKLHIPYTATVNSTTYTGYNYNSFNMQGWYMPDDKDSDQAIYTSIFIDLIDDFNQITYVAYYPSTLSLIRQQRLPDDKLHYSIDLIENIVYNSASFNGVKNSLTALWNPNTITEFTREDIIKFFTYYQ